MIRHSYRQSRQDVVMWRILTGFIFFQVVVGGMTGILVGALILNWLEPNHWVYLQIRDFLRATFY